MKTQVKKNSLVSRASDGVGELLLNQRAFILMPFSNPFNQYYSEIIKPALYEAGVHPVRSDEIFSPTTFLSTIWQQITEANFILAEMTGLNPNVMYELGLSHAIGKNVIMLAQSIGDIPSDLRHVNCIVYDTTSPNWAIELSEKIQKMVTHLFENSVDPILSPIASIEYAEEIENLAKSNHGLRAELSLANKEMETLTATVESQNSKLKSQTQHAKRNEIQVSNFQDEGISVFGVKFVDKGIDLELIRVPKGEFIYGAGQAATEKSTSEFYICRYSITNRQFVKFLNTLGNQIEDGGRWLDLGGESSVDKCRIVEEASGQFVVDPEYEHHPVTYVNFYGAEAFCSWLGGQLPSDVEWEKAARGKGGVNFPWGNNPPEPKFANIGTDGWERDVSPIDVREKRIGMSEFGFIQSIGNVWHWTRTHYPERNVQAVRGGSFFDYRLGSKGVYRFQVQPNGPDFSQGFVPMFKFLPGT